MYSLSRDVCVQSRDVCVQFVVRFLAFFSAAGGLGVGTRF